ncbi:MAG: hypothetical protein UY76_C0057G0006 [Candidatus Uhrbacteria bacterium GW2011_GWA2_52_8d]|uniref:Uncharacterized protein n=1 Tax=Candidatus Uhrbacteria bacterium GW2011_GWA2_52_8d TaxID=1618979 RepID=A0A0G2AG29_9BACT|nr:MAG: hypothetical protein UY76_C0057G0006 [Candidatus Uhrbacteria bacterium GW2011_GWA2_52_8d]
MPLQLVETTIVLAELSILASERFGDLVKAVVDIEHGSMAVGCELHVDAEQLLLRKGSRQQDLWGINLYPDAFEDLDRFVEFDSMINLRPGQGNRSRGVEDPNVREKILKIVRQKVVKN